MTNQNLEIELYDSSSNINTNFFLTYIKEKQNNQDYKQLMNIIISVSLEIYRVLMGSFLVVFIPQKCNNNICTITENIYRPDLLSQLSISTNLITFFIFIILYVIEIKREIKLIKYLEVNRHKPVDNESVGTALIKLDNNIKNIILNYDKYYQNCGYISTIGYLLNLIISTVCIFNNYLDSKTITVLLTNVLFMGIKISDVYSIVNTKKNIFYSAYLTNKTQFNDIDNDITIYTTK